MSKIPGDLKYTKDHEWLKDNGDGTASIGITDYAQSSLGDVTFVELPAIGDTFNEGDSFGVVESVKAASDLYMPVGGEVLEINEALESEPEKVNSSPYEDAWLVKLKLSSPAELGQLMSEDDYKNIVG